MSAQPRIAIIGAAGTMGSALARRTAAAGYHVVVHDRRPVVSTDPSIVVVSSPEEAITLADAVILAVPYDIERDLPASVLAGLAGRIVISMTNPLTPSMDDVVTPHDESAAEHLASQLPSSSVVKALNTISAAALQRSPSDGEVFDTFVASDDREAAYVIEDLIRRMGFRPWYVGGLILSRTLERMTALLIGIAMRYRLDDTVGWYVKGAPSDQEERPLP